MTLHERLLYHHVHPLKLVVDLVSAITAAVLLWQQHLLRAALIGLVPPAIASLLVMQFVNLDRLRETSLGRYVGRYMSLPLHVTAVAGVIIFWLASWYRSIFYCVVGLLIVTFAWVRGPLHESGRSAAER